MFVTRKVIGYSVSHSLTLYVEKQAMNNAQNNLLSVALFSLITVYISTLLKPIGYIDYVLW